jgi:hypothetical protein
MPVFRSLSLLALALLLSACAVTLEPIDDPRAVTALRSGLALTTGLSRGEGVVLDADCAMTVQERRTGDLFEFPTAFGTHTRILPLAPGTYELRKLVCSRSASYVVSGAPQWVVFRDTISYAGQLDIKLLRDQTASLGVAPPPDAELSTLRGKLHGRQRVIISALDGTTIAVD